MESKHHCTTCTKPCTKETCSAWFVRCPKPPPCQECVKPLYEIITYCDVKEKEFNIIINPNYLPIQGFILAFVDECGVPIIFNDCNSFMKIESITPYPRENCHYAPTYDYYYGEVCPFANKYYYTYTMQEYNCMPINPALWSYYININVPLKLSFKLDHNYTGNVFLYINMFYPQEHCVSKLEPIIHNCIKSDQELHCVYNPFACGYISWMTDLQEPIYYPPLTNCHDDYPYNT
jgi:hypothetical protein